MKPRPLPQAIAKRLQDPINTITWTLLTTDLAILSSFAITRHL